MTVFELRDFHLDQLVRTERPSPLPSPGQVVVRVRAASLNYRDLLVVQGKYDPRMKLPRVPLSDGAGEVAAVGEGVTHWKIGDRVVIPFMPGWQEGPLTAAKAASALGGAVDGVLQDEIAVVGTSLLPIPPHLSYEQVATLPCAAVTAWNGLFVTGRLQPGQTLLVQGTGGVSLFGLQFGMMAGARTIVLSSSDAKLERVRALGADHTINYKTQPDWDKAVLDLTDGRGVDHTLEVGGAGTLTRTLRATAYAGEVSLIGVLTGVTGEVQTGHILHKAIGVNGIYVGSREMFAAMNTAMTQHRLKPIIDRTFAFAEAAEAFRHLESGRHFGKIVVSF